MGGACFLSALSAYRSGAGMVRIFTASENRDSLLKKLPEAIVDTYGEELCEEDFDTLQAGIEWADVVAVGPGLSLSAKAHIILEMTLEQCDKPLVIDADALNILSQKEELLRMFAFGYRKKDQDDLRNTFSMQLFHFCIHKLQMILMVVRFVS